MNHSTIIRGVGVTARSPYTFKYIRVRDRKKNNMCELEGKHATLEMPYAGYRNIVLIEKSGDQWTVEICGSGKQIEVYEDEFTLE